jgi:cellulose synthase/poly-beta-1,6-N-acetylglucosamine synthase-like glycosyltransferase
MIDLGRGSVRSILEINLEIVNFLIFSPLILIVDKRLINLVFPTATFIISVSDLVSTWGWYALLDLSGTMRTGCIS